MSTFTPETTHKEAKAQAKAAKAYAKAQRPFYKKKRVLIPAGLVAVVAISMAASGGGSDDAKVVDDQTTASSDNGGSKAKAANNDEAYTVGQTIELEGTEYTVTGVNTAAKIGGQFGEKADGVFVVVDITIENKKDETKTFMDEAATFVAADGTRYEGSDASIYLGDDALWLRDMQPDLPTKGKLVFDVPTTKVAGGLLEVADLFGAGEADITLGLK